MADYPDFLTSTRYGYADGLLGANCRHTFGPWFEWQAPPYTDEQLREQAQRDKEVMHYEWADNRGVKCERDFTLRDALDRQRDLERQMRKSRALAIGFKEGGNDEAYKSQRMRYRRQRTEYTRFSKAMGVKEDWSRVYVDGLGRI